MSSKTDKHTNILRRITWSSLCLRQLRFDLTKGFPYFNSKQQLLHNFRTNSCINVLSKSMIVFNLYLYIFIPIDIYSYPYSDKSCSWQDNSMFSFIGLTWATIYVTYILPICYWCVDNLTIYRVPFWNGLQIRRLWLLSGERIAKQNFRNY